MGLEAQWSAVRSLNRQPVTSEKPLGVNTSSKTIQHLYKQDVWARVHYQQVTDDSKLGTVNKLTVACVFLWLDKLEKWAERNPVKFSKVRGKVLHQECNNPTQQYRLGTNWLAAGGQLTYKIAQAGIFFLEVHSTRTRGNRHNMKPGKFSLNTEKKKFTMKVVRDWSRCLEQLWNHHPGGMWDPSGHSPGQPFLPRPDLSRGLD